jgi:hypothetical protein
MMPVVCVRGSDETLRLGEWGFPRISEISDLGCSLWGRSCSKEDYRLSGQFHAYDTRVRGWEERMDGCDDRWREGR